MLITKEQIKKLDKLWQETVLKDCGGISLLGGKATVAHHFKHKSTAFSLRWYILNGIPLVHFQHDSIHGKNGKELEDTIIKIKGKEWLRDLEIQKLKLAKYSSYKQIKSHILGFTNNYC